MSRFDDALIFAVQAYSGMLRKGSINRFILHPMEAAVIASELTTDEEIIIAALLHDTVEDAGCSEDVIRDRFGKRVLSLVLADTDPADVPDGADGWMERKAAAVEFLKTAATQEEKIVILADRLSNLRSIYNDLRLMGPDSWKAFHVQSDPAVQEWYYREVLDNVPEFRGTTVYEEYRELLGKVF